MMTSLFFWLSLLGNLILILVITGILARLACQIVVVQGESMTPTLADGDYLLVLDWWPKGLLRKGQIVVSKTLQTVIKEFHVKRVVAVAGETVSIPISAIPKTDIPQKPVYYHDDHGLRTWQIPPRHLFVRGDNFAQSVDSVVRGPLPYEKVQGVVLMKLPHTFLLFSRRRENASAL